MAPELLRPAVGILHERGLLTLSANPTGARVDPSAVDADAPPVYYETTRHWQMVPTRLYREADAAAYLLNAPGLAPSKRYAHVELQRLNAIGVFATTVGNAPAHATPHHVAELFLAAGYALSVGQQGFGVGFFVGRVLWLMLYRKGKLVYLASQYVDVDADAIFYLAAHYQHFGLDREACPLYVAGSLLESGQLYRQLSIYFDLRSLPRALRDATAELPADLALLLAYDEALREESNPA